MPHEDDYYGGGVDEPPVPEPNQMQGWLARYTEAMQHYAREYLGRWREEDIQEIAQRADGSPIYYVHNSRSVMGYDQPLDYAHAGRLVYDYGEGPGATNDYRFTATSKPLSLEAQRRFLGAAHNVVQRSYLLADFLADGRGPDVIREHHTQLLLFTVDMAEFAPLQVNIEGLGARRRLHVGSLAARNIVSGNWDSRKSIAENAAALLCEALRNRQIAHTYNGERGRHTYGIR